MSCANYSWTFIPSKNATIRSTVDSGVTYYIILPNEESGVTSNTQLTGIPYCRGMHDGPSSFATKLNTIYTGDSLNKYYTAGNKNTHHVYGSTGLDCSGLACYAYDAPSSSYWTTASFADSNNGYYISTVSVSSTGEETAAHFANMKQMDYMVKSGNHIVLYDAWCDTQYVTVIHASRQTHGKVVHENYSFANLNGFLMKSPYSCTETGCQYTYSDNGSTHECTCSICGDTIEENHTPGAAYVQSTYYHYHVCTKCGAHTDNAVHTFVKVGLTYRCSVCGYKTNNPVLPRSEGMIPQSLDKAILPETELH